QLFLSLTGWSGDVCYVRPTGTSSRHSRMSQTSEPILQIKDIAKIYPGEGKSTTVLDHISFDVYKELLCIVGPSGCGKSKLLRIIDGLVKPTSGQDMFDGEPIMKPSHMAGMNENTYT